MSEVMLKLRVVDADIGQPKRLEQQRLNLKQSGVTYQELETGVLINLNSYL